MGQEPTEEKKKRIGSKEQHNYKTEARELNAPVSCPTPVVKRRMKAPKPVDEDLYKVSPQLLSVKSKKVRKFLQFLFFNYFVILFVIN